MADPIQISRHVLFPLAGALAGYRAMQWVNRRPRWHDRIDPVKGRWVLCALLIGGLAVMGGLVTLRYITWHSFVFDLGSYDQKTWLVAREPNWLGMWQQTYRGGMRISPCGIERFWGVCHFQPWLLIPATVYKVWASPLVLLWLQVCVVASGAIPIFLLARDRFNSPTAGIAAGVLYLLYPAVQYNGVVDYRPDHLAIPTMLWAYQLAGRGQYLASLGVAGLGGLAKETLILNAAFFGAYLAVQHRQRLLGAAAFIVGVTAFYLVTFHLLQGPVVSEGQFLVHRYFPDLSGAGSRVPKILAAPAHALHVIAGTQKMLYLEALFVPLALLPLLAPLELIPAVPSLAISLLSANPDHASIDAQYSASVVAPVFAALLVTIERLGRGGRGTRPVPLLAGTLVLAAVLGVGLAPGPLSLNFWDAQWGGRWSVAQYRAQRQQVLEQAARLIPVDPRTVVVTQNDVNVARLAHRFTFFAFPNATERADYVLVDTGREPYVYWTWSPQRYRAALERLRVDPAYRVIFDRKGVLLFQRREGSRVYEEAESR